MSKRLNPVAVVPQYLVPLVLITVQLTLISVYFQAICLQSGSAVRKGFRKLSRMMLFRVRPCGVGVMFCWHIYIFSLEPLVRACVVCVCVYRVPGKCACVFLGFLFCFLVLHFFLFLTGRRDSCRRRWENAFVTTANPPK